MTPRTRRFMLQIIPFGILWSVFGLIYALIEKGILGIDELGRRMEDVRARWEASK